VDITNLIRVATQARARLVDHIRPLTSRQGAFTPASDEWSIAENVEHLVLAEQGSMDGVTRPCRSATPEGVGGAPDAIDRRRSTR
jgi:hypothetical protein